MTLRLGREAEEVFSQLPPKIQREAAAQFRLIRRFPYSGSVRQLGLCRGLRYFRIGIWLFYYRSSSKEIEIVAILPGRMEEA